MPVAPSIAVTEGVFFKANGCLFLCNKSCQIGLLRYGERVFFF